MQIQPYLNFDGRCDEAIEFYQRAVGAKVGMRLTFKQAPEGVACGPDVDPNKVMHAQFQIGDSTVLASDGRCTGKANFQGISLSLTVRDAAEAEQCFKALAEGGQVQMPLAQTFFSPSFGMLADKFCVQWMVYVAQ